MAYLLAQDTVNGAEGSIVITQDGKNVVVAGMKNIQIVADVQSEEMRVIGTSTIQQKPNGAVLSGSGNIYYGTPLFTQMVMQYMKTGVMPRFDIQITNSDKASSVGRQVMAVYGCTLTGEIPIAVLDDEETMLNYDFEFAYTRAELLESFHDPAQLGSN